MKYGLNQWARISSLLVRKSAKQCKVSKGLFFFPSTSSACTPLFTLSQPAHPPSLFLSLS